MHFLKALCIPYIGIWKLKLSKFWVSLFTFQMRSKLKKIIMQWNEQTKLKPP